jgi:CRISPR-associated protein Csx10
MTETRLIPFTLELEAPAVLTAPGGSPDSARSLEYIPGSVVRGAVARALGDPGTDAGRLETFRRLILSGQVRYLNAYPVAEERRSVPTPLSWRIAKHEDKIFDLAAGSDPEDEPWREETLAPVPVPFVTLGTAEQRAVPVRMSAAVHHQRSRRMGRPVEGEGALFMFEALEAGQTFRGFLAVDGDERAAFVIAEEVKAAAGKTLLLGRSRRAGYGGRARLAWGTPRKRELEGRKGLIAGEVASGTTFRILFLSDLLIRDPGTGAYDPAAVEPVIEERFGSRIEILARHWGIRLVGGFNRTWGLELPQALGLRAGSVLVARARHEIPLPDLLAVEASGLGERLAEGFGRIAFLEASTPEPDIQPAAEEPKPLEPGALSPSVEAMERRILHEALRRHAGTLAARRIQRARFLPSPSLLSRLRTPLRAGPTGLAALRTWLTDPQAGLRSKALHALGDARVTDWEGQPTPLHDWLVETLSSGTEELTRWLDLRMLAQRHHLTSETRALDLLRSPELLADARRRVIDQTLALAARLARRDDERRAPDAS